MVITNEQLVARIQAGEETAANMLQLWQQTKAFVAKLARKYKGYAEFDDLMQEGYLGLNEAVNHYDVSRHIPFINYAAYWIKQRMQRFIERDSTVRLPSDLYRSVMKYRRIVGEYTKMYNREPSDYELRGLLDVSREEFTRIQENAKRGQIRSLSEVIGGESEDFTIEDTLASDQDLEEDVIRLCDLQAMQKNMRETIDNLPEGQAQVIRWRYYDRLTLREIGEKLGCSESKIREMERKAMRKLRASRTSRKYQAYHEQYLTPYPIYHIGIESFQRTGFSEVERAVLGWRD